MTHDGVIQAAQQGLVLVLMISLPLMLVAAAVGLLVSLVQAITSLQDQTISQAVKLIAVSVGLFVAAPWAGSLVLGYAQKMILGAVP